MGRNMNDSGISTVIGIILVLGLIVSIAAVVKLAYIPDVKKQLEADHMQKVISDIGTFKAQLDLDQAAATVGVGFTTNANIEMGGGAIPGIDPSTSYGTLTLDPAYGQLTVVAYQYPSGTPLNLGSAIAMGRLVFQSNTNYYPDQNVSYECGMITLSQPGGTVMLTPPSFIISADSGVAGRPIVTVNASTARPRPSAPAAPALSGPGWCLAALPTRARTSRMSHSPSSAATQRCGILI